MSKLKPELLQVQLYAANLITHIERCSNLIELSKLRTSIRFCLDVATKHPGTEELRSRILNRYRNTRRQIHGRD